MYNICTYTIFVKQVWTQKYIVFKIIISSKRLYSLRILRLIFFEVIRGVHTTTLRSGAARRMRLNDYRSPRGKPRARNGA